MSRFDYFTIPERRSLHYALIEFARKPQELGRVDQANAILALADEVWEAITGDEWHLTYEHVSINPGFAALANLTPAVGLDEAIEMAERMTEIIRANKPEIRRQVIEKMAFELDVDPKLFYPPTKPIHEERECWPPHGSMAHAPHLWQRIEHYCQCEKRQNSDPGTPHGPQCSRAVEYWCPGHSKDFT